MKRLLTILIATLALAACDNSVEVPQGADWKDAKIGFGEVETRAYLEDASAIAEFGVCGVVNSGAGSTTYTPLFDNERVYKSGEEWNYDNVRFWLPSHTYHFFAYYPYGGNSATLVTDGAGSYDGYKLTTSTPTSADYDLLVAHKTEATTASSFPESVDFTFDHAFAKVNFTFWRDAVNNQNDQMRLREVSLINLMSEGTLTTLGSTKTWEYTDARMTVQNLITPTDSEADYISATILDVDEGKLSDTSNPNAASQPFGEDGLLLLPQTISSANIVGLRVVYELLMQDAVDWKEVTLETILPSITWVGGNAINYHILLSSSVNITFYHIQTSIDPWGTPQVGGTVIIK